jgi:hypothetical protein
MSFIYKVLIAIAVVSIVGRAAKFIGQDSDVEECNKDPACRAAALEIFLESKRDKKGAESSSERK